MQQMFYHHTAKIPYGSYRNSGFLYDFQVLEGAEYIELYERSIIPYGNGFQIISTPIPSSTLLTNVKGEDLGIIPVGSGHSRDSLVFKDRLYVIGQLWRAPDCIPTYEGYYKYEITYKGISQTSATVKYKLTNKSTGETKYFNTFIARRDFEFEEPDNYRPIIFHGEIPFDIFEKLEPLHCLDYKKECTMTNHSGRVPDNVRITSAITEGREYGQLYGYGDAATVSSSDWNLGGVSYLADGKMPEDTVDVDMFITASNLQAPISTTKKLKVSPNLFYPVKIAFDSSKIEAGDSLQVNFFRRISGGPSNNPADSVNVEYWPMSSLYVDKITYDFDIIEGAEYGTLYSDTLQTKGAKFTETEGGFAFIADSNITESKVEIVLRVRANIYSQISPGKTDTTNKDLLGYIVNKRNSNNEFTPVLSKAAGTDAEYPGTIYREYGFKKIIIGEEEEAEEILLGETKYFGVKKKVENGTIKEIKIEEVPVNTNGIPEFNTLADGWIWIDDLDVWGTEPVTRVINADTSGRKVGVYWEKAKPMADGNDLPIGMIRTVGRYWTADSLYLVKLKALVGSDSAVTKIKVIKPSALLTPAPAYTGATYRKARDVFNNVYDVDSLCVYYGGLYGIPPQMIKGQMRTESASMTFNINGANVRGFAPSYRYEPYTTQFNPPVQTQIRRNNPFVVDSSGMGRAGASGVPTNTEHRFVQLVHYYETPQTVWDFVDANSQLTNTNNSGTYGTRQNDGRITSVYDVLNRLYKIEQDTLALQEKRRLYPGVPDTELMRRVLPTQIQNRVNDEARQELVIYLRETWNGGLENEYAQTRIAASYGLLQILYTTALNTGGDVSYAVNNTNRPENLCVINTGMLYMFNHITDLFRDNNHFPITNNSNWVSTYIPGTNSRFTAPDEGFEEALRVMYHLWNPGLKRNRIPVYAQDVLENSKNFLPRR